MRFVGIITQFLKKHYEKIILCVVLLGLAGAAIWMGDFISQVQADVSQPIEQGGGHGRPLAALDLSSDLLALAAVTNPPAVVLSGEHNLFNPVTWRRKSNGDLLKFLKTGPDALRITEIHPLYTEIAYDHPSGSGEVYVLDIQQHSVKKAPEYAKVDEVRKNRLYIVRGIKGAPDSPDQLELEIPETQEKVWISKDNPYKRVDGYTVDMKYDPEMRSLIKQRVGETFTLDNEEYNIVEITNNLVRVKSNSNFKVTTINWNGNP